VKTAKVSELKNSLSAHLAAVRAGGSVLVLDRNHPMAIIQPVPESMSDSLSHLAAAGLVRPPARKLNVAAFLRRKRVSCRNGLSALVSEDRDER
jgi:antitoxin (DNA-binding transcriptional repressor) of toxin-antitoxin stability system